MEDFIKLFLCIALIVLIVIAPFKAVEDVIYYYRCITVQNELVYCDKKPNKNMIGKTEDGRTVKLKEYKKVPREE